MQIAAKNPVWIKSSQQLSECAEYWLGLPAVFLDTEFQRNKTFYPIPGLVQLADDKNCYLIDPLTIDDFSPLAEILTNPNIVKVMHAAAEDIEIFDILMAVEPEPLFDTQIAAAILGMDISIGLQRLLRELLSVELDKQETRSNWLQRPLTASQEYYAALDVAWLPSVYSLQQKALVELNRQDWVYQDSKAIVATHIAEQSADLATYYKRFSQMWNAEPEKLAALRDLCIWREKTARKRNRPRTWVLQNQIILQIIEHWPQSPDDMQQLIEKSRRIKPSDVLKLAKIIQNSQQSVAESPPEPVLRSLGTAWNRPIRRLKQLVKNIAKAHKICPELLCTKKDLENLVRWHLEGNKQMPAFTTSWRKQIIGDLLLSELKTIQLPENQSEIKP